MQVPDYGMNEVADQAMGLMLGLVRKICEMNDCTKYRTLELYRSHPGTPHSRFHGGNRGLWTYWPHLCQEDDGL